MHACMYVCVNVGRYVCMYICMRNVCGYGLYACKCAHTSSLLYIVSCLGMLLGRKARKDGVCADRKEAW